MAMQQQRDIEATLCEIMPRAQHFIYLAELTFMISAVDSALDTTADPEKQDRQHRDRVRQAIKLLQQGLQLPGPYGNPEHPDWNRSDVERTLRNWQEFLAPSPQAATTIANP